MKPTDLIQDCGTGKMSHTKLWSHIGYTAMTIAFVRDAWLGGLDEWKLIAYGAIVAGAASISKLISLRYSQRRYNVAPQYPAQPPADTEDA